MTETTSSEAPPLTVGAQLAQARQAQGLSLGEMARQLKLSVKQVDALERDDYSNFPGSLWARGFLRNYAKSLGLNANALIEKSGLAVELPGSVPPGAGTPLPADATQERRRTVYLVLAFVVLGLFVLGLLGQRTSDERSSVPDTVPMNPAGPSPSGSVPSPGNLRAPGLATQGTIPPAENSVGAQGTGAPVTDTTPAEPVSPEPAPGVAAALPAPSVSAAPPATTAPAGSPPAAAPKPGGTQGRTATNTDSDSSSLAFPAQPPPITQAPSEEAPTTEPPKPRTLRFTFTQSVQVEVKDANGLVLLSKLQAAGTERAVRGTPPFRLSLGNVHAVKLVYRGREIDLISREKNGAAKFTLK